MKDRLAALARIAAVQRQMKRMADWHLAEAEREAAEAAEAQATLDAWIATESPRGALAEAAVRQGLRTGRRRERAGEAVAAATEAVREAGTKEKLVERRREDLAREARAIDERKALERLVESFAARGPSALDEV